MTNSHSDQLKLIDRSILYNYWHKPDFVKTQQVGITEKSNLPVLKHLYQQALSIEPLSTKYLLGLASVLNSLKEQSTAVSTWEKVMQIDPSNYQALISICAYTLFNKDDTEFNKTLKKLQMIDATKTEKVKQMFSQILLSMNMKLNMTLSNLTELNNNDCFIVILGFVLDKYGNIQPTLKQRLQVGKNLALKIPKAKILVSSGQLPQEPKIEADVMKSWLINHGIASTRIFAENQSIDTVFNALNSTKLLSQQKAKNIILITSASHMRRAYTLFALAKEQFLEINKSQCSLNNVVAVDDKKFLLPLTDENNIQNIITDSLRINNFWILPEIQR